MSDRKTGVLRNLRIKRVALVDKGANEDANGDGAHIMLWKSAPALSSVHVDSPAWDADDQDDYEKANLSAEGRRGLSDSSFAAVWTDAQGKKHRKLPIHDAGHLTAARGRIDQAQIPADVKAAARRKIEAAARSSQSKSQSNKESNVAKIKEVLKSFLGAITEPDATKRAAAVEGLSKAVDDIEDPVVKSDHNPTDEMCKCADCMSKRAEKKAPVPEPKDPEVAKRLTDIEKRNEDLVKRNTEIEKQLAVEKEQRLDREMVDVLKGFKHTPFKMTGADSDVAKFRKMKEGNPEAFDRMLEVMKAADAQLAQSKAWSNIGSSMSGGGDAWSQIEAKADALVEKALSGGKDLTREQAIEKVLLAHPRLAHQHRSEQHTK